MVIACLIVSMLSNSMTVLTLTLCARSARSIALRIVSPGSKATNVSPLRSAGRTSRRRASRWFGWHTNRALSTVPLRAGRQGAVRRRIGHDPDIRFALEDRLDDLVGVQELELHPRLGVERHEP